MDARYARNIPALTEEECLTIRSKRVLVAGCGGLGGYLCEFMARIGIGFIRAVDGDVFESTNLNRQLLSDVDSIGKSKANSAADRIRSVNPDVSVEAVHCFITAENAMDLVADCDAVLDALDSPESRMVLAKACEQAGVPYIYGAISGWVTQSGISMPGDRMIETLYPAGTVVRDKSVLSFTPALCASMQASLCIKLLTGRPVETGTVYYFDLMNQEFETIPLI